MKSILLVDDDLLLLKALERHLRTHSNEWQVSTARNGLEALHLARQKVFDLLITDLIMPDQDGLGTIREVRRTSPSTKIIAVTGGGRRVGTDFLLVAKALGANEVLEKPFPIAHLIDTICNLLSIRSPGTSLPGNADVPSATVERERPEA